MNRLPWPCRPEKLVLTDSLSMTFDKRFQNERRTKIEQRLSSADDGQPSVGIELKGPEPYSAIGTLNVHQTS